MNQAVEHSIYGRGLLLKKRYLGGEAYIHFESGLALWVKSNEIKTISDDPPVIRHISAYGHPTLICIADEPSIYDFFKLNKHLVPPKSKVKIISPPPHYDIESRRIIEALRLGGVPRHLVAQFTAGRDEEIQVINQFCSSDTSPLFILEGAYGVGKSHMLELVSSIALNSGWAVARIEIDPSENAFHRPLNIYRTLARSFLYPKDGHFHNFSDFVDDIINSPKGKKMGAHPYFKEILIRWDDVDNNKTDLIEWISGQGIDGQFSKIPKLHDAQTAANIYCNIISGIGWAAHNVLELKGLLILFDEAEGIDRSWYTTYQFSRATNFINGLLRMAKNDPILIIEPKKYMHEETAPVRKVGRKTGLQYCGLDREIAPFLWETESNVKIIFSFIPQLLDTILQFPTMNDMFNDVQRYPLEPLNPTAMGELYNKVVPIYQKAYNFTPTANTYEHLPINKTRLFVKGMIESFDILRHDPTSQPFVGSLENEP